MTGVQTCALPIFDVESIVPRTTLLAGLLLAIAADPEVLAWRDDRT